jgi:hypothetical protein
MRPVPVDYHPKKLASQEARAAAAAPADRTSTTRHVLRSVVLRRNPPGNGVGTRPEWPGSRRCRAPQSPLSRRPRPEAPARGRCPYIPAHGCREWVFSAPPLSGESIRYNIRSDHVHCVTKKNRFRAEPWAIPPRPIGLYPTPSRGRPGIAEAGEARGRRIENRGRRHRRRAAARGRAAGVVVPLAGAPDGQGAVRPARSSSSESLSIIRPIEARGVHVPCLRSVADSR